MKVIEKNNPNEKRDSQFADLEIPFKLSDKQKELCRRLDQFYLIALNDKGISPSSIYRGALYAMSPDQIKQNPDWMAQASHSLREIIYPFYKKKAPFKKDKALKQYGSVGAVDKLTDAIDHYYGFLTNIAHHDKKNAAINSIIGGERKQGIDISNGVFSKVVSGFEDVLFEALRRQLETHSEIDAFVEKGLRDYDALIGLINLNEDSRHYFFAVADEKWLDWLWQSGLLDPIKEKPKEGTKYLYNTPELQYLAKVAPKAPEKATDIILNVPFSKENFNQEVLDRFLWICQGLPAAQIARLIPKIINERWIQLMDNYGHAGFEYQKIFDILAQNHDYQSIITLSEAIFSIRTKEDLVISGRSMVNCGVFCLKDLVHTKIFEFLAEIDDAFLEQVLELITSVFSQIVKLGEITNIHPHLSIRSIDLYDFDFFTEGSTDALHPSQRDEIRKLALLMKILAQRTIGSRCNDPETSMRLYNAYIRTLPEKSEVVWRFQLYVMSLCPMVFHKVRIPGESGQ